MKGNFLLMEGVLIALAGSVLKKPKPENSSF